jgi:hypothetical protein
VAAKNASTRSSALAVDPRLVRHGFADHFDAPLNWAVQTLVVLVGNFLAFRSRSWVAWAFELTPEGLKRTEDVDLAAQGQRKSHAWIYVVIVGAALSIG